jgi:hypothetical protein
MATLTLLMALFCLAIYMGSSRERKQLAQAVFIRDYVFHPTIEMKLKRKHPQLTDAQTAFIIEGLRDYFHICNQAGGKMVSMPSQAVDDAWHEFILFSRGYETFCKSAFGRFLYHTPAEAMQTPTTAQDGIKRAWRLACRHEQIDSKNPVCLPRLFAIDSMLAIVGGCIYSIDDCKTLNSGNDELCISNIDCSGGGDGDGGGCSSGCSGGCGGGCGGGS